MRYNLAVVSIGAFFMYAASDALSQCVEFVRADSHRGGRRRKSKTVRRRIFLDLARMGRSGFTSGLLSGFLAVFYFAWLDRTWQPVNLLNLLGQPHSGAAQRRAQWACVAGKVATDVGIYEPICERTPGQPRLRGRKSPRSSRRRPSLDDRSCLTASPSALCILPANPALQTTRSTSRFRRCCVARASQLRVTKSPRRSSGYGPWRHATGHLSTRSTFRSWCAGVPSFALMVALALHRPSSLAAPSDSVLSVLDLPISAVAAPPAADECSHVHTVGHVH